MGNDFIKQWILEDPASLKTLQKKLNSNWMMVKPRIEEKTHLCKLNRKGWFPTNTIAAGNGIFVMKLGETNICAILVGDKTFEHKVDEEDGGQHGHITEKFIMIAYNDAHASPYGLKYRWDVLERLENGGIEVRATYQKFGEHDLKCDREYVAVQENDEKIIEDEKVLSLFKLENNKIRKVFTENLAVSFKLLHFNYPYIILNMKKKRIYTGTGKEGNQEHLKVMRIDANDKIVHHKTVICGSVKDAVYVKDNLIILGHGQLRVVNTNTGADIRYPDPEEGYWSSSYDKPLLLTNGEQLIISSCRGERLFDIDALFKGLTEEDVSDLEKGISKKMRTFDHRWEAKYLTNTVMNKYSITRYTEYTPKKKNISRQRNHTNQN